jgi:hypothetical protein
LDVATFANLIAAGVSGAVIVIVVPVVRYLWDRRRWHAFAGLIRRWAREEPVWGDLEDEDWHALAAARLFEAGFEPRRIKELVDLAVWFAKATANQELRGSVQTGENGGDDGESRQPK